MMRIEQEKIDLFKKMIDQSERILISAHVNPDGDALGSSLSLRRSLALYGKKVDVIKISEIDDYLNFLPDLNYYKDLDEDNYDLFITLDCSEIDRLGKAVDIFKKTPKTIVVDHHVGGKISCDLNIIENKSPATCELIFEIIERLNLPMDQTIAYLLYTGIVTDTGRFMYENVSKQTFDVAGKLLEYGADFQDIYKNLYQNKEISKMKFETEILSKVNFFDNKAYVGIRKADVEKYGLQIGDSESIVNMLRDLKGVELSCILKENGPNEYKVSLRSKDYIDVSKVARENGGGGHIRASGFSMFDESFEKAELRLLEILKDMG
ncbi:MAG: bifunctional oligoribonuclease/PAP phosphatase NrnA [Peptoniphilaceae bacterium]|nr:bifunctional oligoribonuclease/PAP phosphatase NrnA [Peptoniphilaceae bacterium]MDY6019064.1 bifunctional oligoribonuclease/PAP phosphatase NrnA [Anaerococcus sp.]